MNVPHSRFISPIKLFDALANPDGFFLSTRPANNPPPSSLMPNTRRTFAFSRSERPRGAVVFGGERRDL